MKFQATLPITIGDIICSKSHIDAVKNNYQEIIISFNKSDIISQKNNNSEYYKFLDEFGSLLFSDYSYKYEPIPQTIIRAQYHILSDNGFKAQIPNQSKYLYHGNSLNIEKYIVLTTKIRYLLKSDFDNIKIELFNIVNNLSKKYKVIILGEREVEMQEEYKYQLNEIYCIYDDIKTYLNFNNVIDLTIPALGITSSNLQKLQQDCLIMKEATAVIMFGIGGNFNLSIASEAFTIGYRNDNEPIGNILYGDHFENNQIMITKNFNKFKEKLNNL